jgi:hypothetical protein
VNNNIEYLSPLPNTKRAAQAVVDWSGRWVLVRMDEVVEPKLPCPGQGAETDA